MDDIQGYFEEASAIAEANERYTQTQAYQDTLVNRYRKYHHWYAPANDDHWPEDAAIRPGKLHITTNITKPVVDIEARLQAKEPRIVLVPSDLSEAERARAELTEKLHLEYLEASGWENWLHTLCRTKSIYGKGVIKVFWNKDEKRPDASVIENPANLRIGWGTSDFREMDWALYEYSLSPMAAMRRWKDMIVVPSAGDMPLAIIPRGTGTHADPLNQKSDSTFEPTENYNPSDYEKKQIKVWDYWYKRGDAVYNCVILQQNYHAQAPAPHRELLDIPYIVIENDHEPGSPEGLSTIAPIIDIQIEMNREMSHWAQIINDETDPAWWTNSDTALDGMVPKGGQILPIGEGGEIHAFEKPVQTYPIEQLHGALWNQLHRTSGIPEIAFGNPGGSQVSGRALAVQIDGAINRLDPKRTLLYAGLKELLVFWTVMLEKLDPKVEVAPDQKIGLKQIVKGFRRWKIVAPEITPRDVAEHTTNTINKLNAGLISAQNAMDELGVDSPQDELKLIADERSNIGYNPGFVQQQIAVWAAVQQLQLQQEQLRQMVGLQGSTANALGAAQDQTGANNVKAQQQAAQPTLGEGDNQAQPATGEGGVPPLDLQQTTLVRANPAGQGQALNQLAINRNLGG